MLEISENEEKVTQNSKETAFKRKQEQSSLQFNEKVMGFFLKLEWNQTKSQRKEVAPLLPQCIVSPLYYHNASREPHLKPVKIYLKINQQEVEQLADSLSFFGK